MTREMSRFCDHSPVVPSFSELIRQFGNRAGHTWGTLGAHLGHNIVFPGAQLGQKVTWGTLGSWGTLGAEAVGAHLGHSWDKKVT